MGIGIPHDVVATTASSIGCATLTSPFNHLGVKVGGIMSRLSSWDEVFAKISSRLSKWKLKTLSVGGRLTLIKSVLSSLPLHYFSIFKVPKGILNRMEASRRNFFNGVNNSDRKMSLIRWKKILASKKNGGLGVSSLFALNYALLFKWIWRFISNGSYLWARLIKAIYGVRGAMISLITPLEGLHDLISFENSRTSLIQLRDTSLISSFRRPPRGGIEEEMRLLGDIISSVVLSQSSDRWIW
ncbi:hypothetical protein Tco_1560225, partial [Tanacetum coccineum]